MEKWAMAKEWTDEEVRQEIADALRIFREDKFEKFVRSKIGPVTPGDNNGDDKTPPTPPRGDKQEGATAPKKRSLWWGDLNEQS
jgi:hypothetical protein